MSSAAAGGAIARVAQQLGLHPEVLRGWVRAQEKGQRPSGERVAGSEVEKDARIAELERENASYGGRMTS